MATGSNGRNHHRPFPPPKYEYEKRRTQAAKETIAKALMAQMPVLSDNAACRCSQQSALGIAPTVPCAVVTGRACSVGA
eukprot:4080889-Prymnesium_polylepis.1